ncbi:innexin unc-9-like [Symsagittifera roscoffensis]|uniref:innexin unc-9-like n=1 Tax=Symsagittifera roscoffensis TaxID=84072 RepID=UPI00307BF7C4
MFGMISEVLARIASVSVGGDGGGGGLDSDCADRLNFKYSCLLLMSLGALVTTRQFVGESIVCWSPNNFNQQWIKYSDAFCWVSNTFNAPLDTHHAPHLDKYEAVELHYYQWVPLILFLMALTFLFPHLLWRTVYLYAGLDLEQIALHATSFHIQIDELAWHTLITRLARHIDRYLELQKCVGEGEGGCWERVRAVLTGRCCVLSVSRHFGNFLSFIYPAVKTLYLLNVVGQMYLLSLWLGEEYRWYGIDVLFSMGLEGKRLSDVTSLFPRVTWCKVQERGKESILVHNMNCVLPINLFNEMVFLVVWFWLAFVFGVTSLSLARWFLNCSYMGDEYVRKHLKFSNKLQTAEDKKLLRRFLHGYLKQDGVFIIRMLSRNTSSIFVSDLLSEMFELHRVKSTEQRRQQRLHRATQQTTNPPIPSHEPTPSHLLQIQEPPVHSTLESYQSDENLLLKVSEPPSSNNTNSQPAPILPPRSVAGSTISNQGTCGDIRPMPPPLYQRFATNLEVVSTRSCDTICDKKK